MTTYQIDQAVVVFMADVQGLVPGLVLTTSVWRVEVALDDRMCPVAVDPADRFHIQPVEVTA